MSSDLNEGWRKPLTPAGYDTLVACHYPGCFELDFVNETTKEFASESRDSRQEIPWPWKPGFEPTVRDWRRLGIPVLDFTDLAR